MGCGPKAASREPAKRPVRCKDDGREPLDPVGDELAVGGHADLAGRRVAAEAPGPLTGDSRGLHVRVAGTNRLQRFSDPAGDELVVARDLRALVSSYLALALLAGAAPRLLPGQQLGEHVRLAALRRAPVALPAVAQLAAGAVELDREPA
jgi:hypothetical protein